MTWMLENSYKKEAALFRGQLLLFLYSVIIYYSQQPGTQQSCLSTQQVGEQLSAPQQLLFVSTNAVPIANKNAVPVIK